MTKYYLLKEKNAENGIPIRLTEDGRLEGMVTHIGLRKVDDLKGNSGTLYYANLNGVNPTYHANDSETPVIIKVKNEKIKVTPIITRKPISVREISEKTAKATSNEIIEHYNRQMQFA